MPINSQELCYALGSDYGWFGAYLGGGGLYDNYEVYELAKGDYVMDKNYRLISNAVPGYAAPWSGSIAPKTGVLNGSITIEYEYFWSDIRAGKCQVSGVLLPLPVGQDQNVGLVW